MKDFQKTVRLGTLPMEGDVFAKIELKDGRLSISGVIGPRRNGDSNGSAGQFIMSFKEYDSRGHHTLADFTFAPQWDIDSIKRFFDTWDRWHLNDMKAGSPVQEAWLRANPIPQSEYAYPKNHYTVASAKLSAAGLNPDENGYKYGHAWKREDIPQDVLEWLRALPETDKTPAWV